MVDNQKIIPDQEILLGIFPEIPNIPKDSYSIISNNFDRCTFRLSLDTEPKPGFPADLLIRLEAAGSHLPAVAELQRLAHMQIPGLVPATLQVGTVVNEAGKKLDYSITPFLTGTTVLEHVWNGLDGTNQRSLMDSVFEAMQNLQKLPVTSAVIHQVGSTSQSNSSKDLLLGGPDAEYHGGIKELLAGLINQKSAKLRCQVVSTADGIAVHSAATDDRINNVEITQHHLGNILASIVFCHNDLEPRNILVKKTGDDKKAGCLLGSSNLSFNWYSLFKERTAALLPTGAGQAKLIEAIVAIADSNSQAMPRNVGVRVQGKWRERERLRISKDYTHGWIREDGHDGATDVPVFKKQDDENLELEVLKELGYIIS
ncbi:hypothetical protein QBC38DRAFT_528173 [Podospora fimiseda]|uniref:Protein kinase domain-containing protein n=1 Tax=Podospora fimiseda TaxID=252190 RepID=A0AAN7GTL7_9PEZI|nr:hypothetical protein QBC38DRAFT_528173 [Podospora fimiseda]